MRFLQRPRISRIRELHPEEKTPSPLDLTGRAHLAGYRISAPDLSVYAAVAGGVQ